MEQVQAQGLMVSWICQVGVRVYAFSYGVYAYQFDLGLCYDCEACHPYMQHNGKNKYLGDVHLCQCSIYVRLTYNVYRGVRDVGVIIHEEPTCSVYSP